MNITKMLTTTIVFNEHFECLQFLEWIGQGYKYTSEYGYCEWNSRTVKFWHKI